MSGLTYSEGGANGAKVYQVVLTGRATSVPFTAVLAGPERTLTDKTTAATTCGDHHIPS
jgi:hypothetical protein